MHLFLKSDLIKGRGRSIGPKDGKGNGPKDGRGDGGGSAGGPRDKRGIGPRDGRGGKCEGRMPEGEEFGKPIVKREGESSNDFMSRIISHLMKDKGYDQKRAIAAAYSMSGHPKAGKPVRKSLYLAL